MVALCVSAVCVFKWGLIWARLFKDCTHQAWQRAQAVQSVPLPCAVARWEMWFFEERSRWESANNTEPVREKVRGGSAALLCSFFLQQIPGGGMMDEVCTANDTETMGNYLQFKDWKELHYDLALDMRLLMETQENLLLPLHRKKNCWSTVFIFSTSFH